MQISGPGILQFSPCPFNRVHIYKRTVRQWRNLLAKEKRYAIDITCIKISEYTSCLRIRTCNGSTLITRNVVTRLIKEFYCMIFLFYQKADEQGW